MKNFSFALLIPALLLNISIFSQETDSQSKMAKAFGISIDLETARDYVRAAEAIKQVYSEGSYECNARLGWLYYLSNKIDESASHYGKACKLRPNSTESLWGLASALSIKQKWAELNDVYLAIVKLDPKNSLANYYVGLYYYAEKNYAKAKSYFEVSLDLNPMDAELLKMTGWTHYFLKSKDSAIALFNRALILNATNPSVLEGMSLAKKL